MNKKANIQDVNAAISILLLVTIVFFLSFTVLSNFNDRIETNSVANQTTEATDFMEEYEDKYLIAWDYGFLFLLLALPVFSFMAARRIPINPTMMIITFFILGFIVLGGMIGANIYGAMLDNTTFLTFTQQLTIIPFFMPKLLYYNMIYVMIVVIGLFTKEGTL